MVCRSCGRETAAVVNFCPYCGAPVSTGPGTWHSSGWADWSTRGRHLSWIARRVAGVRGFWRRITEGIAVQTLWAQFRTEARQSYDLYSKEVDWDRLQGGPRWKRQSRAAAALFWAVVMKLSPSRRLLLFIALALLVLACTGVVPLAWPLAIIAVLALTFLELADRVIMKRDLEIAREIQSWLVPKVPPQVEGVDIAFATRPANTVAGDYYDAFLRPRVDGTEPASAETRVAAQERLLLVVADVAGKSVPAALLMATFQASLRTLAAAPVSLSELVARLNDYACAHSLGGLRFTTAFFAELDPNTLALSYINAGHNPPILRRASAEIVHLEDGGLPLGIRSGAEYGLGTVGLGHGDLLAVLTDGVVEAENERGEEYGESRLMELLRASTGGSASDELRRLMTSVDFFVSGARQRDDLTCLLLQII